MAFFDVEINQREGRDTQKAIFEAKRKIKVK